MSLAKYKKNFDYSYTYGTFPTLDLLHKKPEKVRTVLLHPHIENSPIAHEIRVLCDKHKIRVDIGTKAIDKLSIKENTYALGVFTKYKSRLEIGKNHVLLASPSNMGNVGTIIRAMIGFGVYNLGIIRPAIDIFDPTIVRSAMGALFDLNFEYFDDYSQYNEKYGHNTVYPFVLNGKNSLSTVKFRKPTTLLFGNEGSGLDKKFDKSENSVRIVHSDKIDSLNLSVSVSLALYELFQADSTSNR